MTVTPYVTAPDAIACPPWVRLGTVLVTQTPLGDTLCGLAHLTYAQALEVATAYGARLPTRAEVYALHLAASEAGTELEPFVLPTPTQRATGSRPGDPAMVSFEWAATHDAAVVSQVRRLLSAAPQALVANAGKHWIGGASRGMARICGWWTERVESYGSSRHGHGFVQEGVIDVHGDAHFDYATTTILARDA